jgi:hypothetical protein
MKRWSKRMGGVTPRMLGNQVKTLYEASLSLGLARERERGWVVDPVPGQKALTTMASDKKDKSIGTINLTGMLFSNLCLFKDLSLTCN